MQTETFHTISRYFDENIQAEKDAEARLLSDQRLDEAVFARIRGNVYGIFSAVFYAAVKSAKDPFRFFQQKLMDIPSSWQTALQQADVRGSWEAAHIERIKLETAEKIQSDIQKLWEENHDGK